MADKSSNEDNNTPADPAALSDQPQLTPSGLKPKKVPMEWYRGLKTKITIQLQKVEKYVKDFEDSKEVVRSQEEKTNIYTPLKKVEDALNLYEKYLEQHAAHEMWQKTRDPNYEDDELAKQTHDFQTKDDEYKPRK